MIHGAAALSQKVDLAACLARARETAAATGALVVAGRPISDGALTAILPFDDLMTVLTHVRPRLVYVVEERFEAEEDTLHRLDEDGSNRALLERPRVKALIQKWDKRDGELSTLVVALVCDGVLHLAIEEAPWLGEHEAAVDEIEDEVEAAREQAQLHREKVWRTRFAPQVKQLLADERFTAGRVSHAKRMHLAEALFPELAKAELSNVVTDAENHLWMEGK